MGKMTCWMTGCADRVEWRMVGADGFAVGYLCQFHKETEYDVRLTHKTTLVRVSGEEDSGEMGKELTPLRANTGSNDPERPGTATGMDTGRSFSDRLGGGD